MMKKVDMGSDVYMSHSKNCQVYLVSYRSMGSMNSIKTDIIRIYAHQQISVLYFLLLISLMTVLLLRFFC